MISKHILLTTIVNYLMPNPFHIKYMISKHILLTTIVNYLMPNPFHIKYMISKHFVDNHCQLFNAKSFPYQIYDF